MTILLKSRDSSISPSFASPSPSPFPYGMREDRTINMEFYPLPFTMLNRAESIGEAAPLNSIGSSVVISDKSVTEFTHSNITTPHRDKTGIPRVEYQIKSIQEAPSQASITLVKEEPIDLTSLDFDEELMSVSETKVSKAVRHADSTRAAKPEASKVVDEELQELEELQKLREEKEKLQRDIELLEKKRKMDEITKKIEDAEARAKRIKTE